MCGSGLLVERGKLLAASRSGPALTGAETRIPNLNDFLTLYVYVPYMYMYISYSSNESETQSKFFVANPKN
jgi:hypothetical protein